MNRCMSYFATYRHSIALVSPQCEDSPAHYLKPTDQAMAIKMGAAADVMFVLCVHTPGTAILEVVNSLKQNVRTEYV